jgi:hypothetical protein
VFALASKEAKAVEEITVVSVVTPETVTAVVPDVFVKSNNAAVEVVFVDVLEALIATVSKFAPDKLPKSFVALAEGAKVTVKASEPLSVFKLAVTVSVAAVVAAPT